MNCQSFKDKFQPVLLWRSRCVCVYVCACACVRARARACVREHLPSRASARSPLFFFPSGLQQCSCPCVYTVSSPSNERLSPADEDEPEDAVSDVDEVPKSKKKKKAKKSSRESRSSKRQRPIREVRLLSSARTA